MAMQRRISFDDFSKLVPFLEKDIRPDRITAAGHVLVEGLGPQEVANLMGLPSRQLVANAVDRTWRMHQLVLERLAVEGIGKGPLPSGWVSTRVAAPADVLDDLMRQIGSLTPPQ